MPVFPLGYTNQNVSQPVASFTHVSKGRRLNTKELLSGGNIHVRLAGTSLTGDYYWGLQLPLVMATPSCKSESFVTAGPLYRPAWWCMALMEWCIILRQVPSCPLCPYHTSPLWRNSAISLYCLGPKVHHNATFVCSTRCTNNRPREKLFYISWYYRPLQGRVKVRNGGGVSSFSYDSLWILTIKLNDGWSGQYGHPSQEFVSREGPNKGFLMSNCIMILITHQSWLDSSIMSTQHRAAPSHHRLWKHQELFQAPKNFCVSRFWSESIWRGLV